MHVFGRWEEAGVPGEIFILPLSVMSILIAVCFLCTDGYTIHSQSPVPAHMLFIPFPVETPLSVFKLWVQEVKQV